MTTSNSPIIDQMQMLVQKWEAAQDDKALFLKCYMMMTDNMLVGIAHQEFLDPAWVDQLLHHFADYYFIALTAYEKSPDLAPAVWQLAHNAALNSELSAIQKLLVGVNAHINYDLVLALADLLKSEWHEHTDQQRSQRYDDYCQVNSIIGRTIDSVQDQVLEPAMPIMDLFDRLLGPLDEILISRLITRWRESVWRNSANLLEPMNNRDQARLIKQVEQEALKLGDFICRGKVQLANQG